MTNPAHPLSETHSWRFFNGRTIARARATGAVSAVLGAAAIGLCGCKGGDGRAPDQATAAPPTVGVVTIGTKSLARQLTMSSELVPFQEIDVYAKESGYVRKLNVDYGSRVKKGDVLAVLEIPELEAQLQQDAAAIRNAADRVLTAEHEFSRIEAQHAVAHLQYERLAGVAKTKPGLVAQQEVDDLQGRDLALEAAVEASRSNVEAAQSTKQVAEAGRDRDRVLYNYAQIVAPFGGVITQRFANLGTLLQAGTSSSTQAMPLVRLSEDSLFRLVIPVPESYVRYIHVGDPVDVHVPALERSFPGKIARFSVDVQQDTRTMHTELDVPNTDRVLIPGTYAEATLHLDRKDHAVAVPLQAVDRVGEQTTVDEVGADNKIVVRPVSLGIQTATDAEVLSGLRPGDLVVVGDRGGLRAGETVRTQVVELTENGADSSTK
jgi:RND family efflux transporter MFP subunit